MSWIDELNARLVAMNKRGGQSQGNPGYQGGPRPPVDQVRYSDNPGPYAQPPGMYYSDAPRSTEVAPSSINPGYQGGPRPPVDQVRYSDSPIPYAQPPGMYYSDAPRGVSPPSPGLGLGGRPNAAGVPSGVSGPAFSVTGNPSTAPQPGLGMGVPSPTMYEDYSMGYPNGQGDPLLMLLMALLERRHPNGM